MALSIGLKGQNYNKSELIYRIVISELKEPVDQMIGKLVSCLITHH
ncbi:MULTISPECIES: hypothetical protein [unclassified Gilliamella]|nr:MULTISPECIES: hypothetical protein [unclassified Gilliamella]MCX8600933.1 hypothetical protein [Gilliamella sp. B3722]MCX8607538.1 hypothetical protein [Gilliamella sp. B3771]MCX8610155.1 hypothetical protein [Gilliamella sp. B3891]MCX8612585.1 hypothetical protein [Gilliamella sp. B3773]MCX8616691.1 hypothetical protein [Gilliamella sp. B3770]